MTTKKIKGYKIITHLITPLFFPGGAERDRTVDLLTASQALSQLSYSPTYKAKSETRISKFETNLEDDIKIRTVVH